MTISIICTNKDPAPWVSALNQLDPTINIQIFPYEQNKEDVEFALCWKHPKGVLQDYPNLKCICSMGAGVDHLLSDPSLPKNIPVIRLVDSQLAQTMFEYILAAIMSFIRDLDSYRQLQQQKQWYRLPQKSIANTNVGIMGLGKLGAYAASKLADIGFNVLGWSRSAKSISGINCFAGEQALSQFLKQTDILVCLLPLTEQTHGILNAKLFAQLPKGASIINVARGEHLIEQDLIEALEQQQLHSACLDVFQQEPLASNHPFWQHSNIIITPHCSSITEPGAVAPQIIENYHRLQQGKPLLNQVDITRGY